MNKNLSKTWSQYEAGKEYKRRIGLYETTRRNERYYRGDQWTSTGEDLPRPVFNVIRRISDYLICAVASGRVSINYSDENLPFVRSSHEAKLISDSIQAMSQNAAYRWERCKMDHMVFKLLSDAAISGDGIMYCYWDPNVESGQMWSGDIVTDVIDNANIFPADVNRADIQSQEYIILSGRASVNSLKAEADAHGASPDDIKKISPDQEFSIGAGDLSAYELGGDEGEQKATYLIKFWKEDGYVCFEKSTRECVIHRAKTACKLYPIAYFNWYPTKNSFHGTSPISGIIPNQNFINRAYALLMKHMTDSAFSKVIYDRTRIPEWSGKIGEPVYAVGSGNVNDAVAVVDTGEVDSCYIELIEQATSMTKELSGATESALGNVIPTNTSAILALQESSRLPLEQVRSSFSRCIEDLANIWADMMCAYYPKERLIPYNSTSGVAVAEVDFPRLAKSLLKANVESGSISNYSDSGTQAVLDKLLDGGHITTVQYLKHIPNGTFGNRYTLIEELNENKGDNENE